MNTESSTAQLRPTTAELLFIELAYNRFLDAFDQVTSKAFWDLKPFERLAHASVGFSVYAELLNYEPIKWAIEDIKIQRPPLESEIGDELFKFIRNMLAHFPIFSHWDEIWMNEHLVTWDRLGTIHKFLKKYASYSPVKFRVWDSENNSFEFVSINFGWTYGGDSKIYLRDIITEREGIRFAYVFMRKILQTQIAS